MNVLISGANGSLGKRLIWALVQSGKEIDSIVVIGRTKPQWLENFHSTITISFVVLDLESQHSLDNLNSLKTKKIDIFVHCAPIWLLEGSLSSLYQYFEFTRLIAFSSTSVLSKVNSSNSYETWLVKNLVHGEKAISHFDSELKNTRHGDESLNWTIFRPTMIYGYAEDSNISQIAQFIERYRFFPIIGKAKGMRRPVHVDDLVAAVLQVMHHENTYGKTYILSGADAISYYQMVVNIFNYLGKTPRVVSIPKWLFRFALMLKPGATPEMANRMEQDLDFEHEEASEDFNYSPKEFISIK